MLEMANLVELAAKKNLSLDWCYFTSWFLAGVSLACHVLTLPLPPHLRWTQWSVPHRVTPVCLHFCPLPPGSQRSKETVVIGGSLLFLVRSSTFQICLWECPVAVLAWAGCANNRDSAFSRSSGGRKSKVRAPECGFWWELSSWLAHQHLLSVSEWRGEREQGVWCRFS